MKKILFLFLFLVGAYMVSAQPNVTLVKVSVAPDHTDWNYRSGDKIKFDVLVTKDNQPMEDVSIRYELSYDMMPAFEKKEMVLKNGKTTIQAGSSKDPALIRCIVYASYGDKEYKGLATAAIDPEKIKPTVGYPDDFLEFWENAKAENAKIPLDPRMTLLPERCTDRVNVYHVSFQNYRNSSRMYGILSVPKAKGKYPALLKVPGAGVRPYYGDVGNAENGIITLDMGIHGIPVILENQVYDNLRTSALQDYSTSNWDNRDKIYYKRVYLGCVKAVDYIFTLEEFDGQNILVEGGSQGGALSVVTAGLDSRIKGLICYYPAISDVTGYLYGRAGGWPHLFRNTQDNKCLRDEKEKTAGYYDVVNFARQLKVPGFYSFGYNDMVCPPTSVFSVINSISAPKEVFIVPETEHWTFPEQRIKAGEWRNKMLGK